MLTSLRSSGVGKSFLLQEWVYLFPCLSLFSLELCLTRDVFPCRITRLLEHLERPFQVTATTGIASLQVSGITIHSWAGVGLGKDVRVSPTA